MQLRHRGSALAMLNEKSNTRDPGMSRKQNPEETDDHRRAREEWDDVLPSREVEQEILDILDHW